MVKTIPEIRAEADAAIWDAVSECLVNHMEQRDIAVKLDVSESWLSRYMNKNKDQIRAHPDIWNWRYRASSGWR